MAKEVGTGYGGGTTQTYDVTKLSPMQQVNQPVTPTTNYDDPAFRQLLDDVQKANPPAPTYNVAKLSPMQQVNQPYVAPTQTYIPPIIKPYTPVPTTQQYITPVQPYVPAKVSPMQQVNLPTNIADLMKKYAPATPQPKVNLPPILKQYAPAVQALTVPRQVTPYAPANAAVGIEQLMKNVGNIVQQYVVPAGSNLLNQWVPPDVAETYRRDVARPVTSWYNRMIGEPVAQLGQLVDTRNLPGALEALGNYEYGMYRDVAGSPLRAETFSQILQELPALPRAIGKTVFNPEAWGQAAKNVVNLWKQPGGLAALPGKVIGTPLTALDPFYREAEKAGAGGLTLQMPWFTPYGSGGPSTKMGTFQREVTNLLPERTIYMLGEFGKNLMGQFPDNEWAQAYIRGAVKAIPLVGQIIYPDWVISGNKARPNTFKMEPRSESLIPGLKYWQGWWHEGSSGYSYNMAPDATFTDTPTMKKRIEQTGSRLSAVRAEIADGADPVQTVSKYGVWAVELPVSFILDLSWAMPRSVNRLLGQITYAPWEAGIDAIKGTAKLVGKIPVAGWIMADTNRTLASKSVAEMYQGVGEAFQQGQPVEMLRRGLLGDTTIEATMSKEGIAGWRKALDLMGGEPTQATVKMKGKVPVLTDLADEAAGTGQWERFFNHKAPADVTMDTIDQQTLMGIMKEFLQVGANNVYGVTKGGSLSQLIYKTGQVWKEQVLDTIAHNFRNTFSNGTAVTSAGYTGYFTDMLDAPTNIRRVTAEAAEKGVGAPLYAESGFAGVELGKAAESQTGKLWAPFVGKLGSVEAGLEKITGKPQGALVRNLVTLGGKLDVPDSVVLGAEKFLSKFNLATGLEFIQKHTEEAEIMARAGVWNTLFQSNYTRGQPKWAQYTSEFLRASGMSEDAINVVAQKINNPSVDSAIKVRDVLDGYIKKPGLGPGDVIDAEPLIPDSPILDTMRRRLQYLYEGDALNEDNIAIVQRMALEEAAKNVPMDVPAGVASVKVKPDIPSLPITDPIVAPIKVKDYIAQNGITDETEIEALTLSPNAGVTIYPGLVEESQQAGSGMTAPIGDQLKWLHQKNANTKSAVNAELTALYEDLHTTGTWNYYEFQKEEMRRYRDDYNLRFANNNRQAWKGELTAEDANVAQPPVPADAHVRTYDLYLQPKPVKGAPATAPAAAPEVAVPPKAAAAVADLEDRLSIADTQLDTLRSADVPDSDPAYQAQLREYAKVKEQLDALRKPAPKTAEAAPGVATVKTWQTRERLRDLGYTNVEIDKLDPIRARRIVDQYDAAHAATPETPAAPAGPEYPGGVAPKDIGQLVNDMGINSTAWRNAVKKNLGIDKADVMKTTAWEQLFQENPTTYAKIPDLLEYMGTGVNKAKGMDFNKWSWLRGEGYTPEIFMALPSTTRDKLIGQAGYILKQNVLSPYEVDELYRLPYDIQEAMNPTQPATRGIPQEVMDIYWNPKTKAFRAGLEDKFGEDWAHTSDEWLKKLRKGKVQEIYVPGTQVPVKGLDEYLGVVEEATGTRYTTEGLADAIKLQGLGEVNAEALVSRLKSDLAVLKKRVPQETQGELDNWYATYAQAKSLIAGMDDADVPDNDPARLSILRSMKVLEGDLPYVLTGRKKIELPADLAAETTVPKMITQAQRQRLSELGATEAQINKMTPEQAQTIIAAAPENLKIRQPVVGVAAEQPAMTIPGFDDIPDEEAAAQFQVVNYAMQQERIRQIQEKIDLTAGNAKQFIDVQVGELSPDDLAVLKRVAPTIVKARANVNRSYSKLAEVDSKKLLIDYTNRQNIHSVLGVAAPFIMYPLGQFEMGLQVAQNSPQFIRLLQRYKEASDTELEKWGLKTTGRASRFDWTMPVRIGDYTYGADLIRGTFSLVPVVQAYDKPMEWEGEPKEGIKKGLLDLYKAAETAGINPWPALTDAMRTLGILGNRPVGNLIPEENWIKLLTGVDVEGLKLPVVDKTIRQLRGEQGPNPILIFYTNEQIDNAETLGEITPAEALDAKATQVGPVWDWMHARAEQKAAEMGVVTTVLPIGVKGMPNTVVDTLAVQTEYYRIKKEEGKDAATAYLKQHPELSSHWLTTGGDTAAEAKVAQRWAEYNADKATIGAKYDKQIAELEAKKAPERTMQQVEDKRGEELGKLSEKYADIFKGLPAGTSQEDMTREASALYNSLIAQEKYDLADKFKANLAAARTPKNLPPSTLGVAGAPYGPVTKPISYPVPSTLGVAGQPIEEERILDVTRLEFDTYRSRNDTVAEALRRVLRDDVYGPAADIVFDKTRTQAEKDAAKLTVNKPDRKALVAKVLAMHPEWKTNSLILTQLGQTQLPSFDQLTRANDTPAVALASEVRSTYWAHPDGSKRNALERASLEDMWGSDSSHIDDTVWLTAHPEITKKWLADIGRLDGLIAEGFPELGKLTGMTQEPGFLTSTPEDSYIKVATSAAYAMAREFFPAQMVDDYFGVGKFWEYGGKGAMPEKMKPLSTFLKNARVALGLEYDDANDKYALPHGLPSWYTKDMETKDIAAQMGVPVTEKPVVNTTTGAITVGGKAPSSDLLTLVRQLNPQAAVKPSWWTGTTTAAATAKTTGGGTTTAKKTTVKAATKTTAKVATPAKAKTLGWTQLQSAGGTAIINELSDFFAKKAPMTPEGKAYMEGLYAEQGLTVGFKEWIDSLYTYWKKGQDLKAGTTTTGTKYAPAMDWAALKKAAGDALVLELTAFWMRRAPLSDAAKTYLQQLHDKSAPNVPMAQWGQQLRAGWEKEKYGLEETGWTQQYKKAMTWANFIKRASPYLVQEVSDYFTGKYPLSNEGVTYLNSLTAKFGGGKSMSEWLAYLKTGWTSATT